MNASKLVERLNLATINANKFTAVQREMILSAMVELKDAIKKHTPSAKYICGDFVKVINRKNDATYCGEIVDSEYVESDDMWYYDIWFSEDFFNDDGSWISENDILEKLSNKYSTE